MLLFALILIQISAEKGQHGALQAPIVLVDPDRRAASVHQTEYG